MEFFAKSKYLSKDEDTQKENSPIIKNESALRYPFKTEVTSMQEENSSFEGSNSKIDEMMPMITSIQIKSQSLVQNFAIDDVIPAIETNQCESNLPNDNGKVSLKKIEPISKETKPKIIAVGNPGAGKSTILNSMAEEVLFKSGVSVGKGMTYKLDEAENKNGHFLDTPGLADEELRKKAGEAISEGLRQGGSYKVIFFVTQESGRVNQQDATTLRLVLEAAPDIGKDYGIIVNKVSKGVLKTFKEEALKFDFLNSLFAGIPEERKCVYSNAKFFGRISDLEDEKDKLFSPFELKDDSDLSLNDFVHDWIPTVEITEKNVADIDTERFDEMSKKMEIMAQQLQEKDDQWKEERHQLEAKRIKESEETRRQIKELKDQRMKDSEENRKLQEKTEQEMRTLLEKEMYDLLEKHDEELEIKKKEEWEALEDQRRQETEENRQLNEKKENEIQEYKKLNEQLKQDYEKSEQRRKEELKHMTEQIQNMNNAGQGKKESQAGYTSLLGRFFKGNSKIEEEKLNWSMPHDLVYDIDLRNRQLDMLKCFGPNLQLCRYSINLSGLPCAYEHHFVTDGTYIIEFGSGNLEEVCA